ncbi:hypothetical protein Tco_1017076 [Tanacetum coccineum]|uniref:Uncharacterized protein n=1 Tax=Tanacetum coccineum TaxID=301880 RepID=A0ABQ5FQJ5_9ASTR
MSIQDMEDLKQHYLDKMLSLSNDLQIKDYRNDKIDIRFRRECESMIDELKGKFNGMSIEINKKKELQHLEQVATLSTYPSGRFNYFYDDDDEESSIPLRDIISELPMSVAITPDLPITDSLIIKVQSAFVKVVNIESKDSYVSNLDDPALLVTPLFDFNEDECFDPGGDVDEITLLLHRDPSTPKMSVASTLEGFIRLTPLRRE